MSAGRGTACRYFYEISGTVFRTCKGEIQIMDFEVFIESLLNFIKSSDNAYFVMYAAATCVLTQIAKKLFVSKVKVDVLHKFDFAVILPFIFGAVFAVIDIFAVKRVGVFSIETAADLAVDAAAIGALASTLFKSFSSISGKKLSKLMSDDVFGMFYTQLLYYGNVREQLLNKTITLQGFIDQVKLVSANAADIYKSDETEDVKRQKLAKLLMGIIDEDSVNVCVNVLNKALINYVGKTASENKAKEKIKKG